MKQNITCQHINKDLAVDYLQQNTMTFAMLYKTPECLAEHTVKMNSPNARIINLPLDSYLEAELFGAELLGYNQNIALKPINILYDLTLPAFNIKHQRLQTTLEALKQIAANGQTPCLNLSGFAMVFDALYGSALFYTEWFCNQQYIAKFLEHMLNCYLQIISEAVKNNIRLFSFAEPTLALPLIGKNFAMEYINNALIPFLHKIKNSEMPLVFNICLLTTNLLQQSKDIAINTHTHLPKTTTSKLLANLAADATSPIFIGNNCINNHKTITSYDELVLL